MFERRNAYTFLYTLLLFPFLHLLYLASLDNFNSFLSKYTVMTNSQKSKEKIKEKVALSDGSCCDDSCCTDGGPSLSFEREGRRGGGCC